MTDASSTFTARPYSCTSASSAAAATASRSGLPIMRPLCLVDPEDPEGWAIADSYLLGPSLGSVAVFEEGQLSAALTSPAVSGSTLATGEPLTGAGGSTPSVIQRIPRPITYPARNRRRPRRGGPDPPTRGGALGSLPSRSVLGSPTARASPGGGLSGRSRRTGSCVSSIPRRACPACTMARLIYSAIAAHRQWLRIGLSRQASMGGAKSTPSSTNLERTVGTYLYGRLMYETMAVGRDQPSRCARSELLRDYAEICAARRSCTPGRWRSRAPHGPGSSGTSTPRTSGR